MERDERAFEEFVRARLAHLLRFGRALTGNDRSATSLVEQALAPVLARWGSSAVYTAEDDIRRAMVDRFLRHKPLGVEPADRETERDEATWRQLDALPARQRIVVALRCHEELSAGQVADVLGCSAGTVDHLSQAAFRDLDESRVRRALEEPVTVEEARLMHAVRRETERRRRRRTALVGALTAAAALALGSVTILGVIRGADPGAVPRPGLEDPVAAFYPAAEDQLWAVTRDPDCAGCSRLWHGDGTATGWRLRHGFDQSPYAAQLRMAPNGMDGWAWFGRDWLQSTHDGGRTWLIPGVDLRSANVEIRITGDTVWLLLYGGREGVQLWSSAVGSDDWRQEDPPPPGSDRYALTTLDGQLLVVDYPRLRPTGVSAPPFAERHEIPCVSQPLPPLPSDGALWATCDTDGGVDVLRSTDGRQWTYVVHSPATAAGAFPISAQRAFVVTATGARVISTTGQPLGEASLGLETFESVEDGAFVTARIGFLLTSQGSIVRTDDGGRTWDEIG